MASIGKIKLDNPVCLAPMAGFSTVPYRVICKGFGSAYAPTELCSARSIRYRGVGPSYQYLRIDPGREGLTSIQLFGFDPVDFEYAIGAILDDELLSKTDMIDINMGCPVPKVIKTGAGSALMKTPKLAGDIVRAARKAACGKPVTVKTRIGFDRGAKGDPDFIKVLADAGSDMICVHGRTAAAMYSGQADIEAVALMGKAAKEAGVTFFANGDIQDGASALKMKEKCSAQGLMVGRAAQGNPWVFDRILKEMKGEVFTEPSFEERKEMLLKHLKEEVELAPSEDAAVRAMRSVFVCYVKGLKGAAELKDRLCRASTVEEVEDILWN